MLVRCLFLALLHVTSRRGISDYLLFIFANVYLLLIFIIAIVQEFKE